MVEDSNEVLSDSLAYWYEQIQADKVRIRWDTVPDSLRVCSVRVLAEKIRKYLYGRHYERARRALANSYSHEDLFRAVVIANRDKMATVTAVRLEPKGPGG